MEKISYEQIVEVISKHEGEAHTYMGWINILKPLREIRSPLAEFANQLSLNGKVSNAELYEIYTKWCCENNALVLNKTRFAKRIPIVFSKTRRDIKPYRSDSERGFYSVGIDIS